MFFAAAEGVKAANAPTNDNFADAPQLVLQNGNGSLTTTNTLATKESGEPRHAEDSGGKSVGFKFTPTATKIYRIVTAENNFDTVLAVYTGSAVNNLQSVGYNDDCNNICNDASAVNLMLTAGTTYYIAVDGVRNGSNVASGDFKIAVTQLDAPENDNLSLAYNLGSAGRGNIAGANFNATREAGEPVHYNFSNQGVKTVWYKWKIGSFAYSTEFELTDNFNSMIAVYSTTSANPIFNQLTKVAGAENGDFNSYIPSRNRVKFFAEVGKTYYIAVSSYFLPDSPLEGNFQLKFGRNHFRYSTDLETRDDKSSLVVFRPSAGAWYSLKSSSFDGMDGVQWGANGDVPVQADFDGDGETDVAVVRNANGAKNWYIYGASNISGIQWGLAADKPVVGDFDGDGRADVGVMRLSAQGYNWYIRQSSDGALRSFFFGANGDKPVFGDFDGDGLTEVAVARSTPNGLFWYMLKSLGNYTQFVGQQFGSAGDVPVAEDYDGDGKTDIAVFRPSNGGWYYLRSSDNKFQGSLWGTSGDKPQPADYDGDGRADTAVFRPSDGTWYIFRSGDNQLTAKQFGAATDIPVSSLTSLSQ